MGGLHGGFPRGVFVPGRAVPGHVYASPFYRPYYNWGYHSHFAFRPWVNLGYGVWLGYPYYFGYPYYYGYPYHYASPYPYVYGSAPSTYSLQSPSYSSSCTQTNGALSFEITPPNAEVWVDGTYVGVVADFAPTGKPLELTPGRHAVEIRASGYRTIAFDADLVAGEVLPYQGSMQHD